ncbi:MAG: aspartate kinase [Flavobacteriales bacterium MED-G22]|nr:MAG: aspartate kinase [Flavobacteriales bacterium MED-G22]|tara:strand:+ start:268 stop:927 length:660 start_codon:yes stop_codon:yes gene_type:complete
MRTIASEVTAFIKTKPFLSTALSQGIINLTSLAREIQPEIEQNLRKPAKSGAIVMALKRISDNLEFISTHKIVNVLKNLGDITVRSSLVDYSFANSDSLLYSQAKLLTSIEDRKDIFYTSSRGVSESNIIVSANISELVAKLFVNEVCNTKLENLSSITVQLPKENIAIPGIYYFIFQRLSWEGVNLNEVISTSNEFTILMDESQVNTAFEVIKNLKKL